MDNFKTVFIPSKEEHGGTDGIHVTVKWECPVCHKPRGPVYKTQSFDGSRRLDCDGWINECGHVDKYSNVVAEYKNLLSSIPMEILERNSKK